MSNEQLENQTKNVLDEKAYQLAIRIVNAYKYLTNDKKEFVLAKQLLRSGTSIGANVAEANGAIDKAEFSAKISIAYKECGRNKILAFSPQRYRLHRRKIFQQYS